MGNQNDRKNTQSQGEDSHKALKAVVIGMGLALIGGLVLLFALAYQKITNPEKFAQKETKPVITSTATCDLNASAVWQADEDIMEMMTFETTISIQSKNEAGAIVWRSYDRCTGAMISRFSVNTGALFNE